MERYNALDLVLDPPIAAREIQIKNTRSGVDETFVTDLTDEAFESWATTRDELTGWILPDRPPNRSGPDLWLWFADETPRNLESKGGTWAWTSPDGARLTLRAFVQGRRNQTAFAEVTEREGGDRSTVVYLLRGSATADVMVAQMRTLLSDAGWAEDPSKYAAAE